MYPTVPSAVVWDASRSSVSYAFVIVPPAESESMSKSIPGARLAWCEKSGHLPMMEEPELVSSALTELLRRT